MHPEVIIFFFKSSYQDGRAYQIALVVKILPANSEDIRDVSANPGSGRSPGGGHDHPLQYSCLENPMDKEAWEATVHGVTESDTNEATEGIEHQDQKKALLQIYPKSLSCFSP